MTIMLEALTAPYVEGDYVYVEVDGKWQEAQVQDRGASQHPVRFGLYWTLLVRLPDGTFRRVKCDDNGRNHTWKNQVTPSSRVEE